MTQAEMRDTPSRQQNAAQADVVLALLQEREYVGAEECARAMLAVQTPSGFGWKVLAAALGGQGRWPAALEVYRAGSAACGDDWEFHNNHGNALKTVGALQQAEAVYRAALELHPAALEPQYNLALTLMDMGRADEAEQRLLGVLALQPAHALAHLNLADLLNVQGSLPAAERHYLLALAALPQEPKLWNNFGQLLAKQKKFAEAEACYRRALELDGGYGTAMSNLAELLAQHGLVDEAVVWLRRAVDVAPGNVQARSNLLFTLAHQSEVSASALFAEHMAFAEVFEEPLRELRCTVTNVRDPERPLRIGIVSADLRDHPVVRYLRPALERMRTHADLTLLAYNNSTQRDAETQRYGALFHGWRDVAHSSDAALAEQVQRDGVDVLIDLSGHTGFHRLLTLARRPAPVQVSWMGYVGTTGLEAVDYFVADRHLVPQGFEAQFREKILWVPATTVFAPVADAPEVNELPALRGGGFTFCSLARMNKLNRATVEVWARVLRAVPRSTMVLAAMPDGSEPCSVLRWFAGEGIGRERLRFVRTACVEDVLRTQTEVDLSLDTFPYCGSTSNSHAAWMGVPTVTLAGDKVVSRMGAALAGQMGLAGFVAHTSEEYVELAAWWAENVPALAVIRAGLRQRFAASPLMQTEVVTDALVGKLREAWRRYCAGKPPQHV